MFSKSQVGDSVASIKTRISSAPHRVLNPFVKPLASHLAEKCGRCGKERLFTVFDAYLGRKQLSCPSCRLTSALMKPTIRFFFSRFSISDNTIKELLGDSTLRRSMLGAIKGVAAFGIRQPQPAGAPVVIVWNFTNRCNLNCLHCHQDSSLSTSEPELTTQQAFKVIDKMADAGVAILTFSGGEPLLRHELYDAVKRADDSGMLCTVASNGTLVTRNVAEELAKAGIQRVEIGLDGAKAETHDFLRNTRGSFEATVRGIKNCVELDSFQEVCVTTTLNKSNLHEIPQIVDLAEELGATRFYLNRLIPAGRGKNVSHLDVTPREKAEVLECLCGRFHKSVIEGEGIQCYTRGMTYFARVGYERSNGQVFNVSEVLSGYDKMFRTRFGGELSKIVRGFATSFGGCSAGLTYCGLSAQGDVLPCVPAPIKLGNLLEQDLEEIWIHSRVLNRIRDRGKLTGSCGQCRYNGICGGCRYTAYYNFGDWLGPDSSCPYGAKL